MSDKIKTKREAPNPVEIHLGARLRQRRNLMGMSQEQLGKASGLTFQQIQKYERGANRMAASRLEQFAQILNVSIAYFYDGKDAPLPGAATPPGFAESGQAVLEGAPGAAAAKTEDVMTKRETMDLIRAYYSISDSKKRRQIYDVIKSMADEDFGVSK